MTLSLGIVDNGAWVMYNEIKVEKGGIQWKRLETVFGKPMKANSMN